MAWTNPRTWIFDEIGTETHLNTHVRDNLLALQHHYHQESATRSVSNTTTETSLFATPPTIAGGDLGANGRLVAEMDGYYKHDTTDTLRLNFYFGGAAVLGVIFANGTPSALFQPWNLRVSLTNMGATNSQVLTAVLLMLPNDAGAPSLGDRGAFHFGGNPYPTGGVAQTATTVDTTSNQTFDIKAQWGAASANNDWSRYWSRTTLAKT